MEASPWDPEGVEVVLGPNGTPTDEACLAGLDLKALYKHLVAARCLDLRLGKMNVPAWASSAGEEAPIVLAGVLAEPSDWIYPGWRDSPGVVAVSAFEDVATMLVQSGQRPSSALRVMLPSDTLGMHLALAAGHAHAQKLDGRRGVTIALFGEGLTTTGIFHETVATAVQCDVPLVLVCKSQLWPDAAPAEAGLLGDTVSERARACGLWSRRVDGADVIAVYMALASALERARDGRGPGLVEAVVTQLHRDVPAHRDPIERMRRLLDHKGLWTQTFQDVVEADIRARLEKAFTRAVNAHEEARA